MIPVLSIVVQFYSELLTSLALPLQATNLCEVEKTSPTISIFCPAPPRAGGKVGHSRAIDFQVCVVPGYLGQNTIIAADRVALN